MPTVPTNPYHPDYMLNCAALFGSHSDDRTKVYHGAPEPLYLCGKHASNLTPADYVAMGR